ncbi:MULTISPECIES: hypothetical protein [unclassified Microcoleus]|uniref:hypothetical protein n=1 Tax=unclassified Microcoleus TaxID=2642155 RepID=UPI002FD14D2C
MAAYCLLRLRLAQHSDGNSLPVGFHWHRAQWGEVTLAELTGLCFQGRSKVEGTYLEGIRG